MQNLEDIVLNDIINLKDECQGLSKAILKQIEYKNNNYQGFGPWKDVVGVC